MTILGIDEVGRGPWAGPLVVGACILPAPRATWQDRLTDSKRLTAKQRAELSAIILQKSTTALGWVSAVELDQLGLSQALKTATRRAVQQIQRQKVPFTEIIIDGTVNFLADTKLAPYVTTIKKADLLIKEVSAASIVAKVARDQYMIDLAKKYPQYGFDKHMGYGTALHRQALQQHGPCPEHRTSFRPVAALNEAQPTISQPVGHRPPNSTQTGQRAEQLVAEHLTQNGHTILARNYKTKTYEIDIISQRGRKIYFTEVKYRKGTAHGQPLEAITAGKQRQMRYAATAYLKAHATSAQSQQPQLAVASVSGPDFQLDGWFPLD